MPSRYVNALETVAALSDKLQSKPCFKVISMPKEEAKSILIDLGMPEGEAITSLHAKMVNVEGHTLCAFGLIEILMDKEFEKIVNLKAGMTFDEPGQSEAFMQALEEDKPTPEDYQKTFIALDAIKQVESAYVENANKSLAEELDRLVNSAFTELQPKHPSLTEELLKDAIQAIIRSRLEWAEETKKYGVQYPTVLSKQNYNTVLEEIPSKPPEEIYRDSEKEIIHPRLKARDITAIIEEEIDPNVCLKSSLPDVAVQEAIGSVVNWYVDAQYLLRRDMSRYLDGIDIFKDKTGFNTFDTKAVVDKYMSPSAQG